MAHHEIRRGIAHRAILHQRVGLRWRTACRSKVKEVYLGRFVGGSGCHADVRICRDRLWSGPLASVAPMSAARMGTANRRIGQIADGTDVALPASPAAHAACRRATDLGLRRHHRDGPSTRQCRCGDCRWRAIRRSCCRPIGIGPSSAKVIRQHALHRAPASTAVLEAAFVMGVCRITTPRAPMSMRARSRARPPSCRMVQVKRSANAMPDYGYDTSGRSAGMPQRTNGFITLASRHSDDRLRIRCGRDP